ncbi:MAG: hypothetical protein ACKOQY_09555 [Bacteroidota bacterium]
MFISLQNGSGFRKSLAGCRVGAESDVAIGFLCKCVVGIPIPGRLKLRRKNELDDAVVFFCNLCALIGPDRRPNAIDDPIAQAV